MKLGYNTNGLPHHRLLDAITFLAEEGYQSVALTLDTGSLDPYEDPAILKSQVKRVRDALERLQLSSVVETGARFLLNPRKKHDPTLMDPNPERRAIRVDFLCRAIDLACELNAECVSFWSGILPDVVGEQEAMDRLVSALSPVINHAELREMPLAFEPEPGMFIDTFARFADLDERINHPLFDLTVDVGHVHCLEPGPIGPYIEQWGPRIRNVHIEDMKRGVHDHLMFGEGTIDFADVIRSLRQVNYQGGLHVELSRHGHMAAEAVLKAKGFLAPLLAESSVHTPT